VFPVSALVSVVIPTHDRAELVGRAVRSALEQSAPPAEVIVVDDCSSDRTPETLREFGDEITVIRTAENVERGAARNLGVRSSRGAVIAFLDSDDEWTPGKLEAQMAAADAGRTSVTALQYIDDDSRPTGDYYEPSRRSERRITIRNDFLGAPSSLVVSRRVFDAVGGFVEERAVQGSEDWLFLLRLLLSGHSLDVIREPLVRYRIHAGSDTADPARREQSVSAAVVYVEREGLITGSGLRRLKAHLAGDLGRGFAVVGDSSGARRWARRALDAGSPLAAARAVAMIGASSAKARARRGRT